MSEPLRDAKIGGSLGEEAIPVFFKMVGAALVDGEPLSEAEIVLDFELKDGSRMRLHTPRISANLIRKGLEEVERRLTKLESQSN